MSERVDPGAGAGAKAANASPSVGWRWTHTYAGLPELFFRRVAPTPVREPRTVLVNRAVAEALGLDPDQLERPESAAWFTGNTVPPGADPLAQAYAGHQFGHFTALGDGRAILIGEQLAPSGERFDLQWKGAGPTPYSRRGDGRAALGPMLREYVISEAMAALGIPTTRSLAVAATGEPVFRDRTLRGAVLTRVAASHLRVGTFEWAAASGEPGAVRALADYAIRRHYPGRETCEEPYLALLDAVMERQASLVARWLHVGFVHGVMNTDNMAISGETIDYGPCAFLDTYDPATVFSSIDHHGRYAYKNQPAIAQWNLVRFAEALLPLFHSDEGEAIRRANAMLETFGARFRRHWLHGMRAKLGLFNEEEGDVDLVSGWLEWMERQRRDFTSTFRSLATAVPAEVRLAEDESYLDWRERWLARLSRQPQSGQEVRDHLRRHNPAVIPRNHKVEEALEAATSQGDLGPVRKLLAVVTRPFDDLAVHPDYLGPAPDGGRGYRTFCGT